MANEKQFTHYKCVGTCLSVNFRKPTCNWLWSSFLILGKQKRTQNGNQEDKKHGNRFIIQSFLLATNLLYKLGGGAKVLCRQISVLRPVTGAFYECVLCKWRVILLTYILHNIIAQNPILRSSFVSTFTHSIAVLGIETEKSLT